MKAGDLDGDDGHRLSVAKMTVENFVAQAIRLYQQKPGEANASARFGSLSRIPVNAGEACYKSQVAISVSWPLFLIPGSCKPFTTTLHSSPGSNLLNPFN